MYLRAIVKEPFKDFQVVVVNMDDFSKLVGGLIEYVPVAKDMEMVINEEGKLLDLPANLKDKRYDDVIFGTAIFIKIDVSHGGEVSLTEEEAEDLMPYLKVLFESVTVEENKKIDPEDYMKFEFYSF